VVAALLAVVLVAPFAAMSAQESAAPTALPEVDATIRAATSQKNYEMLDRAATAYAEIGKYDVAQTLLVKALAIRGEIAGEQSTAYVTGLVKLGDTASKLHQRDEADSYYTKAVALGDRPEVASALMQLGLDAAVRNESDQAFSFYQRVLNVAPNGPQAALALRSMARLRQRQPGREPEADSLYQRALGAVAPDSADEPATLDLYARFLRIQNRANEAEPLEARAKLIRQARIAELTRKSAQAATVYKVAPGVISAPTVLSKTDPEYSEEARAEKFQGTVLVYVEIGPDGLAHNIKIQRSLGLGLDEKAIEAIMRWRFKPGTKDGQPVTVAANIEVNFRLL
ncbi:MAG TPA: TonB family protein, partial [Bryobacteraceae bacterium]